MSRQILPAQTRSLAAHTLVSWSEAAQYPELSKLFDNDKERPLGVKKLPAKLSTWLGGRLKLKHQAFQMLCSLNDFDRVKVIEEIIAICRNPSAPDVSVQRRNAFQRLRRSRYPFGGYHYLVKFAVASPVIIVDDIYFDEQLLGVKEGASHMERNALYRVKRNGHATFDSSNTDREIVNKLIDNWDNATPQPVHRVETRHAAVNGMLNELSKATWLMGTHLDTAYKGQSFDDYTLFHNPSDGAGEDLLECGYDKRATGRIHGYSHNVHHLAAVLNEAQQRGQRTHWVAHSQGAIIFARAVRVHLRAIGTPLNHHKVSLHGVGCNMGDARLVCQQAMIQVVSSRNNPFDMVPNLAGGNDLSASGLWRSLKFMGLVAGDDSLASPHTLPYLGIDSYHRQLLMTGNHDRARTVARYMAKGG
ncbi:hypothetical protein PVT67_05005 [Gallaecimonas kandeliae]|uniref:hypothetical protein n=1 Tax=Gallaecimonas kandeliae TaxID=3029055 RepID=UPI002648763F|nr:hypothetical protein [Gallaecimonas kandeliae]WKE66611.1 hypothetical protein PVT67_05005 [Gallaecimonas kandeliae]